MSSSEVSADREVLLGLLGATPGLEGVEVGRLEGWWASEGLEGEGLAEFLVRVGVFGRGAVGTLASIRKGFLRFEDATPLLGSGGLVVLRERLAGGGRGEDTLRAALEGFGEEGQAWVEVVEEEVGGSTAAEPTAAAPLRERRGRRSQRTSRLVQRESQAERAQAEKAQGVAERLPQVGESLGRCMLTELVGRGGAARCIGRCTRR